MKRSAAATEATSTVREFRQRKRAKASTAEDRREAAARIGREQRLLGQLRQMFLLSGECFHFETFCASDLSLLHFSGDLQPVVTMVEQFRPRHNLHLQAVHKLCDSCPALSRVLLAHPTWLWDSLMLWSLLEGEEQVEACHQHLVDLVRTFHRQHRSMLQRQVSAFVKRSSRYSLIHDIVDSYNRRLDLPEPPFLLGATCLSVLMACGIFRREQVHLLENGFLVVHSELDQYYQKHQQVVLQLDPALIESNIMTKLVTFRSQCELQRRFLRRPAFVAGMHQLLQRLLDKSELTNLEASTLMVLADWRSSSPVRMDMDILAKLVHLATSHPEITMDSSACSLSRMWPHVERQSAPCRRMLGRVIGRWSLTILKKAMSCPTKQAYLLDWAATWRVIEFARNWLRDSLTANVQDCWEVVAHISMNLLHHHIERTIELAPESLSNVQRDMGHIATALADAIEPRLAPRLGELLNVASYAAVRLHAGWAPCATGLMIACAKRCPEAADAMRAAPKYDPTSVAKIASTAGWTAALPAAVGAAKGGSGKEDHPTEDPPDQLLCPLTCEIMEDPVELPSSKQVVDRLSLERHLRTRPSDPFTNAHPTMDMVSACPGVRRRIAAWHRRQAA